MIQLFEEIEKLDKSIIALGHLSDSEVEMEQTTIQHIIDLIQCDMSDRLNEVFQFARKLSEQQKAEAQAQQEARKLAARIDAARARLENVTNEILDAASKNQDAAIGQHIARTACEIGAAMRVLRGQDDVVELRIARA